MTDKDGKTCFYADTNDFNQQTMCGTPICWLKYATRIEYGNKKRLKHQKIEFKKSKSDILNAKTAFKFISFKKQRIIEIEELHGID